MSIAKLGKNAPMFGKHLSDETKLKLRFSHLGKKYHQRKLSESKFYGGK